MFDWIGSFARFVGYGAMICGVVWILNEWAKDRAASRSAQADRDWLEKLRIERPEMYENEMWERNNMDRLGAGLPADPRYIEKMKSAVNELRENGLL